MKKTYVFPLLVLALIVGFLLFKLYSPESVAQPATTLPQDYKNATYTLAGEKVTLIKGVSEVPVAPQSASKVVTRYFGNEVMYDFDKDGREDTAFILTQSTGGSGVFFYVVVALNTSDGYIGSEGLFLGDRIAPQTTEIDKRGFIIVNYADRKAGESFATRPSLGKSLFLKLDTKTLQLGEVVQNFEGEADPLRMSLDMKTWKWIRTLYSDSKEVTPVKTDKFVLTFSKPNRFSASTDCNGVGGEYAVSGNKMTFDKMMSTQMYCEGSQEAVFSDMLSKVQSYHFTSKGELIFDLKFDSGTMTFR